MTPPPEPGGTPAGGGWTLLGNDDGVDSPALVPFARALAARGEVRVVVPDRERSWIGKAITRVGTVTVATAEVDGLTVTTCSGTPADAVQLGVHALWPDGPPALVVAGINLGYNHGSSFVASSGTLGAAIEGHLAGIPSIAFSCGVREDFAGWRRSLLADDHAEGWARLATRCVGLVDVILEAGLHDHADVVSVNLPFDADEDTPVRVTTVAETGYDGLFTAVGEGGFVHDLRGGVRVTADPRSDVAAADDGAISITALRLPRAVELPSDVRARVERA
ncbi:MAG: 5'/3'-nucleotidase SurE [Actinomycetes bacterium]